MTTETLPREGEPAGTPALDSLFSNPNHVAELSEELCDRIDNARNDGVEYESPSSIKSFRTCPGMWYAERYYLPRQLSNVYAQIGTFVHRILECHYSAPLTDDHIDIMLRKEFPAAWDELTTDAPLKIITPAIRKEFEQLEHEDGGKSPWLRGMFYKRSREALRNVAVFDGFDADNLTILANEVRGRITTSRNIVINGKIDRIILDEDGNEVIEDWKSGRDPDENEPLDVTSSTFVPVGLYALMRASAAKEAGRSVSAVSLLYLKSGNDPYTIDITPEVTKKAQAVVNTTTLAMREVRETGTLPLVRSSMCRLCPLSKTCPTGRSGNSDYAHALHVRKEEMESYDGG